MRAYLVTESMWARRRTTMTSTYSEDHIGHEKTFVPISTNQPRQMDQKSSAIIRNTFNSTKTESYIYSNTNNITASKWR